MTRRAGWLAAAALAAACGDNAVRDEVFTPVSGARLALQWYGFPDGTRQPEPGEFYDTAMHTRCTPQRWTDDVVRCVPVAERRVYADAACTEAVGPALPSTEPTHFLGYETIEGVERPAHVYRAGDELEPLATYFEALDEQCLGPFFTPLDTTYHAVQDEVPGGDLVPIHDAEVGEGRVGLRVRTSDDGMLVGVGLRDRMRDAACVPATQADGSVRCEPIAAPVASYFRDPACAEPLVAVAGDAEIPTIARVTEASGCAAYRAVGAEHAGMLYRRAGEACVTASVSPAPRVFALGEAVDVPALARTFEVSDATAGRRLQRMFLADGELRFADERLYDTAMRAECARRPLGDVTRCLPATLATADRLFTPGCIIAAPVAELPPRTCVRPGFAIASTPTGTEIHAIGDPVTEGRHHWVNDQCVPYVPAAGAVLHALGPPIDPTAFAAALYFGER